MWVIALVAGLVGLAVFVLSVPLEAVLNLDTSRRPKLSMRLVWLFGLVSKELGGEKEEAAGKKVREKEQKKKGRRAVDPRTALKLLRARGLPGKVMRLVRGILGQLRIRELAANLRLGLGDPADTGLLFAVITPAIPFLNLTPRCQIRVQPCFHDELVFEGHIRGALSLQPVRLVRPLAGFVFSMPALRAMKVLVRSRWRRKR